jgi:hypothetical protein
MRFCKPTDDVTPFTLSGSQLNELLATLASFRSEIANRGPVLAPGQTFKDWAREGLKW